MSKSKKQNENLSIWSFFVIFFLVFSFVLFMFRKQSPRREKLMELVPDKSGLNSRQEKILDILCERGEVTVEELLGEIGGVTERTLRRDMRKLEEMGWSKKEGNTKGSIYIYTY